MIEESKSEMEFNCLEDLISYYKEYGKKCGFGVMTKRTERGAVSYTHLVVSFGV